MAGHDTRRPAISPAASAEEAAAIVATIERFMRSTAPAPAGGEPPEPWRRAAILEGIEREPANDVADPWINT
jgi:hypothetical protein